jgi:hypothetical protein
MKTLATQRSLSYLRKRGWQVAIVEKWIPARGNMKFGRRIDVWGFGDLLACRGGDQIALIQCFPAARWNDHVEKLKLPEIASAVEWWKGAGGLVFLHGWVKRNKGGIRGARKEWQLREELV